MRALWGSILLAVMALLFVIGVIISSVNAAPFHANDKYMEECKESKIDEGLKCAREFDKLWRNRKTEHCPMQILICMFHFHIQDYDFLKTRVDFM